MSGSDVCKNSFTITPSPIESPAVRASATFGVMPMPTTTRSVRTSRPARVRVRYPCPFRSIESGTSPARTSTPLPRYCSVRYRPGLGKHTRHEPRRREDHRHGQPLAQRRRHLRADEPAADDQGGFALGGGGAAQLAVIAQRAVIADALQVPGRNAQAPGHAAGRKQQPPLLSSIAPAVAEHIRRRVEFVTSVPGRSSTAFVLSNARRAGRCPRPSCRRSSPASTTAGGRRAGPPRRDEQDRTR